MKPINVSLLIFMALLAILQWIQMNRSLLKERFPISLKINVNNSRNKNIINLVLIR